MSRTTEQTERKVTIPLLAIFKDDEGSRKICERFQRILNHRQYQFLLDVVKEPECLTKFQAEIVEAIKSISKDEEVSEKLILLCLHYISNTGITDLKKLSENEDIVGLSIMKDF